MIRGSILFAFALIWAQTAGAADLCNPLKIRVMVGSCGGEQTGSSDLNKACDRYPDQVLVKCRETCALRKRGICQKCGWEAVSSAACTDTGDRMKMNKCGTKETFQLQATVQIAKAMTEQMIQSLKSLDKTGLSSGEKERFAQAEETTKSIINWLNEDRRFICKKDDRGLCRFREMAAVVPLAGGAAAVRLCESFFKQDAPTAAAILIHEGSHSCCRTTDAVHFEGGRVPTKADKWHQIADTYAYWAKNGVCVPSKDSCVKR